jgi:uncharacterized protein YybS (DUF2232 family)
MNPTQIVLISLLIAAVGMVVAGSVINKSKPGMVMSGVGVLVTAFALFTWSN